SALTMGVRRLGALCGTTAADWRHFQRGAQRTQPPDAHRERAAFELVGRRFDGGRIAPALRVVNRLDLDRGFLEELIDQHRHELRRRRAKVAVKAGNWRRIERYIVKSGRHAHSGWTHLS